MKPWICDCVGCTTRASVVQDLRLRCNSHIASGSPVSELNTYGYIVRDNH
jgi:hypothetical protein